MSDAALLRVIGALGSNRVQFNEVPTKMELIARLSIGILLPNPASEVELRGKKLLGAHKEYTLSRIEYTAVKAVLVNVNRAIIVLDG